METLLEKVVGLDQNLVGSGRYRKTEEHSSLVLDLEKQIWYWNSQNLKGGPLEYLLFIRKLPEDMARALINDLSGVSASEYVPHRMGEPVFPNEKLVDIFWKNGLNDRDYWYHRCLVDSTIDRFRLGKYDGLWTLPIYVNGKFRNFQCRTDVPKKLIKPWYRGVGPLLFNSNILQIVRRVFITEGPIDAILMNQVGYPAVSHTGGANGWNDSWFPFFRNQKEIFYVADNDKAGYAAARKVANSLGKFRVRIISFLDYGLKYDFVDFIRNGGSKEEFDTLVEKSQHIMSLGDINGILEKKYPMERV